MAAKKKHRDSGSYAPASSSTQISLVNALLDIIKNKRDSLLVRILAETGCTSQELVHLHHNDIQENFIVFRAENTKNKASRTVAVSKGLSFDLGQFSDASKPYIFSSDKSPRLRTASVRKIFAKYSGMLGQKITSSSIRKEYLLESLRKKPVDEIKESCGLARITLKDYLSEKDFFTIRDGVKNKRDQLCFDILFETGCRLQELVQLRVGDVEFTSHSIIFSAVKPRPVPISERLSLLIKAFVHDSKSSEQDFLLSTRQSRAMSDKRVFQIIKEHSEKAGFENINPQTLRNSSIARMISSGKTVEDIIDRTGIQSLHRIDLYGSLLAGANEK